MINTYVPFLGREEKKNINNCFRTNFFSTAGPLIQKFENSFSKTYKFRNSVALNSGTSSLHLGLKALGVKKGDLVIVPSYTFAATVNAIIYCEAEPWFFDINEQFEIDLTLLDKEIKNNTIRSKKIIKHRLTRQTVRAIIPVSSFGKKIDFNKYLSFAKKNKMKVLYDVAASHDPNIFNFTKDINMHFCFSFNGNKTLTAGSGGVFSSNSTLIAKKVKMLANVGKSISNYDYVDVGYNYRMSNIQAAIALAQLKKIKNILRIKKRLFQNYREKLKLSKKTKMSEVSNYTNWVFFLILENKKKFLNLKKKFNKNGIQLNYFWKPLHCQKPYKSYLKTKMFCSLKFWDKIAILPSHPGIKEIQQRKIIKLINEFK